MKLITGGDPSWLPAEDSGKESCRGAVLWISGCYSRACAIFAKVNAGRKRIFHSSTGEGEGASPSLSLRYGLFADGLKSKSGRWKDTKPLKPSSPAEKGSEEPLLLGRGAGVNAVEIKELSTAAAEEKSRTGPASGVSCNALASPGMACQGRGLQ